MVASSSAAAQASESEKRKKQTMEKVKVNHLSRQLQMRLQYARLKVEHGWQQQNLNEVENLYFHNSHLRGSKSYPVPTIATTQPQPPPFPPPQLTFSQSRLSFRYGPTPSRNLSGILGTEPSVTQSLQDLPIATAQAPVIPDPPTSTTNMDISAPINAPDDSSMYMAVSSKEDTPSLPIASASIPVNSSEGANTTPGDHAATTADSTASPQDAQSPTDAPQSTNNYYPTVKPTRARSQKAPTGTRALPSLTAKDMYNFGSSSTLTYDSFWSSHSGGTTPRPARGTPATTLVPGDFMPTFLIPGDFTSGIQDHSRPNSIFALASASTTTTASIYPEIPRNPGDQNNDASAKRHCPSSPVLYLTSEKQKEIFAARCMLVDSFIDYNYDDLPTLLASALVSRQWTPASRYHVFSNVDISHENAREIFQLVSSPNCTFTGVLRCLTIHFVPGSQRWFSEFSRRLSSVDRINITSLTLSGPRNTIIREEAKLALSTHFAQIKEFKVTTVVFESFAEFATLLCTFGALESLFCAATFQNTALPQDVHFAAPLRSLDITSPSITRIFEFLLAQGVLPTVASLSLSHPVVEDYTHLSTYLSTSNEVLRSLSVRMDGTFSGVTIDEFGENLNMTQLRALRHLVIDTTPALSPDQAFNLLSTIRSQLMTLKVALQLVQGVSRIDILLSGGSFFALRELIVLQASWADVRQFLPRCDMKGILREV